MAMSTYCMWLKWLRIADFWYEYALRSAPKKEWRGENILDLPVVKKRKDLIQCY
jgi:hypothetical protein